MSEIDIFVCCHREYPVPSHPLLRPIHAGAALSGERLSGFQRDDEGDNISALNRSYCELTALYWAWKNARADFCGLFHYRRYLYPEPGARRPYILRGAPTAGLLERLGFGGFEELIRARDLILPTPEEMYVSVREHYAAAPDHHGEDLALAERILGELYPGYAAAADRYLSGTRHVFGNLCIMRRDVLDDYCRWLFAILAEFDRRADVSGYGPGELRVDGYLAERLLGIYCTQHRADLRVQELPRVHFEERAVPLCKERALYFLLPPGSRRRAAVKRGLLR
ncbi:MAG: DUF4422 domain-containing protein [Oscillospiraceae bacterium]|nr:DUF4422 domain-containing protein [Oscillospiraceae bacterium]